MSLCATTILANPAAAVSDTLAVDSSAFVLMGNMASSANIVSNMLVRVKPEIHGLQWHYKILITMEISN